MFRIFLLIIFLTPTISFANFGQGEFGDISGGGGSSSGNGVQKGNGTGGFTTAVDGTDYLSPAGVSNVSNKTIDTANNTFKVSGTTITGKSGNSGVLGMVSGAVVSTHYAGFDANGNIVDNGAGTGPTTITASDQTVIFSDGANNPVGNSAFKFNKTTGALSATSFITASTNTPQSQYYPTLAADTHWIAGVNGNGDGINNDHWVLSEGTTLGSNNRIDCANGGSCNIPILTVTTVNSATVPSTVDTLISRNSVDVLTNKSISGTTDTLTNIPASSILGVISVANLATGTPNGSKFIRDDGTLQTPAGGGSGTVNSGTANQVAYYATSTTAVSGQTGLQTDGTSVAVGTTTLTNGKFAVVGTSDQVQSYVKGNATQTNNIVNFVKSDGTSEFSLSNAGLGTLGGAITTNGSTTTQNTLADGLVINSSGNTTANGGDLSYKLSGGTVAYTMAADTGLVTKYNQIATVNQGQSSEVAVSNQTGLSAAVAATTLYAVPTTGYYRVCWASAITTAGTTSSLGGTSGLQIRYTSPTDSVVKTDSFTSPSISAGNTTGTSVSGCDVAYAKTGTNLQYLFGYSSTGTTMVYELHVVAEAM